MASGQQLGEVVVDKRFCGPPDSGNGGYVCGRVAAFVGADWGEAVEVTLRKPPPLDRAMKVYENDQKVQLLDGDTLVAEARQAVLSLELPTPPSLAQAEEASKAYAGFAHHVFPTCFVCGPKRDPGDGLRLFAGKWSDQDLVATPWTPDASLAADKAGETVAPTYQWAAMDCPGAFAVWLGEDRLVVLGRLTAILEKPVKVGERYVVVGWPVGSDGKKFFAGTAIFDQEGQCYGRAQATWIAIKPSAFGAVTKAAG